MFEKSGTKRKQEQENNMAHKKRPTPKPVAVMSIRRYGKPPKVAPDDANPIIKIADDATSLDLNGKNIGDAGAKVMAEVLKTNSTLRQIDLSNNNIGDAGAKAVAEALVLNSTFEHIDLRNNPISLEGAEALALAYCANESYKAVIALDDPNMGQWTEKLRNTQQALNTALEVLTKTKSDLKKQKNLDNAREQLETTASLTKTIHIETLRIYKYRTKILNIQREMLSLHAEMASQLELKEKSNLNVSSLSGRYDDLMEQQQWEPFDKETLLKILSIGPGLIKQQRAEYIEKHRLIIAPRPQAENLSTRGVFSEASRTAASDTPAADISAAASLFSKRY